MIYAVTPAPAGPQLFDDLDDAMQLATSPAAEHLATGAYAIPAIDAGFALDLHFDAPDAETRRRVAALVLAACAPAIADPALVANVNAACAPVDEGGVPDRLRTRLAGHAVTSGGPHGPLVDLRLCDVGGGGRLAILALPYAKLDGVDVSLDRPTPISEMIASGVLTPAQITRAIRSMIPAIAEADWWTGLDYPQLPRFVPEERPDVVNEGRRYVETRGIVKHTSAPWPEKIWDDWCEPVADPEACCRDCADGMACHCDDDAA